MFLFIQMRTNYLLTQESHLSRHHSQEYRVFNAQVKKRPKKDSEYRCKEEPQLEDAWGTKAAVVGKRKNSILSESKRVHFHTSSFLSLTFIFTNR